ncbi:MAG: hypothetical protein QW738_06790 [Nitrososphaeria archaeon]
MVDSRAVNAEKVCLERGTYLKYLNLISCKHRKGLIEAKRLCYLNTLAQQHQSIILKV